MTFAEEREDCKEASRIAVKASRKRPRDMMQRKLTPPRPPPFTLTIFYSQLLLVRGLCRHYGLHVWLGRRAKRYKGGLLLGSRVAAAHANYA